MQEIIVPLIGSLAGFLTTVSFMPQVYKTLKSRSTHDLSWAWLSMMLTGVFCWLIYGFFIWSYPIIFANIVTFFALLILWLAKWSFERE